MMKTLLMFFNVVLYAGGQRDHYDARHSGGKVPSLIWLV
jgi:hypothetical protein